MFKAKLYNPIFTQETGSLTIRSGFWISTLRQPLIRYSKEALLSFRVTLKCINKIK
jgi:hypothetical protein